MARGAFTFEVAVLGALRDDVGLVAGTVDAVAQHVARVFPRSPQGRYLVTLFAAAADDGESFTSSAAFTTASRLRRENVMLWGNNLAHELYHIWIGGAIRGDEPGAFEWFDEGFTDYYADLALVQSGIIDDATFLRKAEKVLARAAYFAVSPVFQRLSLIEASPRRGVNRFGVYDGGWTAAFCLDGIIQESTNGTRALDDLMRALHETHGLAGRPFSHVDFVSASPADARVDVQRFFDQHIAGRDQLPVRACAARVGLEAALQDYAAELWLTRQPNASALSQAMLERIVRGPVR